jgi:demethylmenaquinone methyltransferase/2-methoxy-6-polyprenyl-1,4-benzoquinol methylase
MRNPADSIDFSNGKDFYALIAPFYDALVGPFLRAVRKDIADKARSGNCRRVLEVCCGTGEQAIMLARSGMEATGVDLSGAMLRVALGKGPPEASYVLGNAEHLPFEPGAFDCVSISLALHEMAYQTAVRVGFELLRVLAPNGQLIVFDYAAVENARFSLVPGFIGLLERIAGRRHFSNFVRFTRMGGIGRFLEIFPLKIISTGNYFFGSLQLIVAQKEL